MISLYLARHGQTEENIARIFQGHLPGRLTVEGISQAEVLRDSLKRIPLDAVVSSDLKRCMDTAEIVKEVDLHHIPADVETEEMLYQRAGCFLDYIKANYEGKTLLAVGHGLINRAVQAHIQGVTLQHLRSVPKMDNAELRLFML